MLISFKKRLPDVEDSRLCADLNLGCKIKQDYQFSLYNMYFKVYFSAKLIFIIYHLLFQTNLKKHNFFSWFYPIGIIFKILCSVEGRRPGQVGRIWSTRSDRSQNRINLPCNWSKFVLMSSTLPNVYYIIFQTCFNFFRSYCFNIFYLPTISHLSFPVVYDHSLFLHRHITISLELKPKILFWDLQRMTK